MTEQKIVISKLKIKEGLEHIQNSIVCYVIEFLKTKEFRNKNANAYMVAYNIVVHFAETDPKALFDYYMKTVKEYLNDSQRKLVKERGEKLIELFIYEYDQAKILIYWMRNIFISLDHFYTKSASIGTLSLNALKLCYSQLLINSKEHLFETLNIMIEADRNNEVVDRTKIKNLFRIFEEIDMKAPELKKAKDGSLFWTGEKIKDALTDWFKKQFKKDTETYVSNKASKEISRMSCIEYVKSALKYLSEEEARKEEYISREFHKELDQINFKNLIDANAKTLAKMDTGIRYMLLNEKIDDLGKTFELFQKSPDTLKVITEELDPFIREKGEELFNNKELAKDTIKFVPELIKLKNNVDSLVNNAFHNHILFNDTKNKAFTNFMNKEFYAKQIANFCDYEMKIGIKGNNEQQTEEKLNNIINLFRCLNNKLVFQVEYSKKLSDRLIRGMTQSMIAEKNFISKLKAEAGVAYVNKMTSMLSDLDSSKEEMNLYRNSSSKATPSGIPFAVQVLQNAWDIDKSKFEKLILPRSLNGCLDDFNAFYIGRHKNHKLTWALGLGDLEIQYLKLKKQYKSKSTLVQYLILYNLEKREKIKISQLAELIGTKEDMIANEASFLLYHPSFNPKRVKTGGVIASDATDNQDLEPTHTIWANADFSIQSLVFTTIPTKQRKKPGEDEENEQREAQNLKAYRNIIIDATVTRIMKGRIGQKTTHAFLVQDVAKQIEMFQAQPPQIKERIEALIEKQIIKRKDDDKSCYEYVA